MCETEPHIFFGSSNFSTGTAPLPFIIAHYSPFVKNGLFIFSSKRKNFNLESHSVEKGVFLTVFCPCFLPFNGLIDCGLKIDFLRFQAVFYSVLSSIY